MASVPARVGLAVAVIIVLTVIGGLTAAQPPALGDGTATVAVVSPTTDDFATDAGRFGTAATYLRLPDLVADVESVTGQPRLVYRIAVPELDVDAVETRLLDGPGRYRVALPDHAFAPPGSGATTLPDPGTYAGRLVVRVQSFSTDTTVLNRTVRVRVSG